MRYTSFGIEDDFLILDFFYDAGGNVRHVWTDETNHRNCNQSTQTEALQNANHSSVHTRLKITSENNLTVILEETSPMKKKQHKKQIT